MSGVQNSLVGIESVVCASTRLVLQDVHSELIQHRRAWMIKRGIVKGKLSVDSAERRRNGTCPLSPEEVERERETTYDICNVGGG